MHHFGETHITAQADERTFTIVCRNAVTGAAITVSGPVAGIFEDPGRVMDSNSAWILAADLAHFFRQRL